MKVVAAVVGALMGFGAILGLFGMVILAMSILDSINF